MAAIMPVMEGKQNEEAAEIGMESVGSTSTAEEESKEKATDRDEKRSTREKKEHVKKEQVGLMGEERHARSFHEKLGVKGEAIEESVHEQEFDEKLSEKDDLTLKNELAIYESRILAIHVTLRNRKKTAENNDKLSENEGSVSSTMEAELFTFFPFRETICYSEEYRKGYVGCLSL